MKQLTSILLLLVSLAAALPSKVLVAAFFHRPTYMALFGDGGFASNSWSFVLFVTAPLLLLVTSLVLSARFWS